MLLVRFSACGYSTLTRINITALCVVCTCVHTKCVVCFSVETWRLWELEHILITSVIWGDAHVLPETPKVFLSVDSQNRCEL